MANHSRMRFLAQFENAGERCLFLGGQSLGLLAVVAAVVRLQSTMLGLVATGCGLSAMLALSVRQETKRGRAAQLMAAAVALIAAVAAIAQGSDMREARVPQAPHAALEKAAPLVLPPASRASLPAAAGPVKAEKDALPGSIDGYVRPVSDGSNDEYEPATHVAGVQFPDLGDGNPFESVAMSKKEAAAFNKLYKAFWANQKALQEQLSVGEIDTIQYNASLAETSDELMVELVAVLGQERTDLLTQELVRYYQKMAMNPAAAAAKFKRDEVENSDLVKATQHLVPIEN
jgi:hypothetical protein